MKKLVEMKRIKVEEMSIHALSWLVADLLGWKPKIDKYGPLFSKGYYATSINCHMFDIAKWEIGGPILEWLISQGMLVEATDKMYKTLPKFKATLTKWETSSFGDTLLIAAMKCFVVYKCGEFAEIPTKLA